MATLKDALDIISKLSYDDLESLKTIVLGGATYKTDTIENFTKDNRFSNGRVCPICGCIHKALTVDETKALLNDMDVSKDSIFIYAVAQPYSSYLYEIDGPYLNMYLKKLSGLLPFLISWSQYF